MKIANRFRLTFPAALAAVVAGGSAVAAPKDEPIAEISTSLGDFVGVWTPSALPSRSPTLSATPMKVSTTARSFIASSTASWCRAAALRLI